MNKRILIAGALVFVAAFAFAAAEKRISFAGEVFSLKGQPQITHAGNIEQRDYETMDEKNASTLQILKFRGQGSLIENDQRAKEYFDACQNEKGMSCLIDACFKEDDVLVQATEKAENGLALTLKRFTPKGFIVYRKYFQPDEKAQLGQYRTALCGFDAF